MTLENPALKAAAPRDRVASLDVVRALACLLIVNYHTKKLAVPGFEKLAVGGFFLNLVFFCLSGYLLGLKPQIANYASWYSRRLKRIAVPFFLCLVVIFCILTAIGRMPPLHSIPFYFTGLHYFFGMETFGDHLWFISVLLVCYAVFPIVIRSPAMFLALAGAVSAGLLLWNPANAYARVSSEPLLRLMFHMTAFLVGAVAATSRFKLHPAVTIGCFFVTGASYLLTLRYGNLLPVVFGLLVALSFIPAVSRLIPGRLHGWFVPLAAISFEIYLVHYVIIDLGVFLEIGFWSIPFVYLVTLLFAWTLNRAVEWVFSRGSAKSIGAGNVPPSPVQVTENVRDLQGARGD